VTDSRGLASDAASVTITAGNSPPTAVIDTPTPTRTWTVGDTIGFSGHASDPQDGTLPATRLSWSLILHHCATSTDCHTHAVQDFNGVASGSFSAPDHEFPAWIELRLTATDSGGLADTAYTASRTVTAGNHEVKVEYYENGSDAVAKVTIAP
jgi:hypothetical protein